MLATAVMSASAQKESTPATNMVMPPMIGYDFMRMNTSNAPGHDFYQYACGSWIDKLPNKPQYARYNQFDIMKDNTKLEILNIINSAIASGGSDNGDSRLISTYYKMYMDSARINRQGGAPLKPYLEMVDKARTRTELAQAMAKIYRMGTTGLFMSISISGDYTDPSQNMVNIYQGGLSLSAKKNYTDTSAAYQAIRSAYKTYINNIFVLAGYSPDQARKKCGQVLLIENNLASNAIPNIKDNPNAYNHKTRFDSLEVLYPGFPWVKYFQTLGYPRMEYVNVKTREPIAKMAALFAKCSMEVLKSYIQFKFIISASKYLSEPFLAENLKFQKEISGVEADIPRHQKAIDDISSLFGMAVGKLYCDRHFSPEKRQMVAQMVENIKESFKKRIQANSWLSKATKEKAIEKLMAMKVLIGHPENWRDYKGLTLDTSLSMLDNYLAIKQFNFDYTVSQKVNKSVNMSVWDIAPQTINAFYRQESNSIIIPAGILQAPFFDPNADIACNYGGIGCVIGHEITHGFDNSGRRYDKDGKLCNWWTAADTLEFYKRSLVMVEYFNKKEVLPGEFANGQKSLSENIADNGGIKIAFDAMQKEIKWSSERGRDRFTPQQRFFLHYAYVSGGKIREQEIRKRLNDDPHALMELRVNGQMPHIDSWYKAFLITEDSPMYIPQSQRVDIW